MNRHQKRQQQPSTFRAILLLTVVTTAGCAAFGQIPTVATVCKPASCHGDHCPQVTCSHGSCSPQGECVCSPCFTGSSCDTYKNAFFPQLSVEQQHAAVPETLTADGFVFQLSAVDADTTLTCRGTDCPCSQVVYAIESGNTYNLFQIDERTGVVSAARDLASYAATSYKLYVSVVNRAVEGVDGGSVVGPKNYGVLTVTIGGKGEAGAGDGGGTAAAAAADPHQQLGGYDENGVHSRHKRAVSFVSNITFTLIKTGIYNLTTTLLVGTKVHFQLQIAFPQTTTDLLVELFTPDNDTTVMLLCSPQITFKGSNIAYTNANVTPVLDSKDGSLTYDRAVLDFGNVTNTGARNDYDNQSMIFIEWDAVTIETAVNNTQYWVSAGAEYNNHDEIWIGQAGFVTKLDVYTPWNESSSFNISGPDQVLMGTSSVFRVDMYLPSPLSVLGFEAFAPINYTDAMSVCSIVIVDVGNNYECLPYYRIPFATYSSTSGLTNERGRMDIGRVINSGSREKIRTPFNDSVISVEFVVFVPYNASLINTLMWVGAAVEIGSDQIWAGEVGVLLIDSQPGAMAATPTFTLNSSVNAAVKYPVTLEYNMTVPMNTDTNYTLAFEASATAPRFKICGVLVLNQGVNVPCLNPSAPIYIATISGTPYNKFIWNLGRIKNTGQRSTSLDPWANTMQFIIYVQLTNHSANVVGSSTTMTATMSWSTNLAVTLVTNVNIVARASNVTNSTRPIVTSAFEFGTGTLQLNQSTDYRLRIGAYPNMLYDPVYLEITVPYDNTSTVFSICRVELVSVGKNLPCVNQTAVNASVTYSSLSNFTGNYKAQIFLDTVCSIGSLNGTTFVPTDNDTLEFSIIVRIEDHPSLYATPTNNIATGLKYLPDVSWQAVQPVATVRNLSYMTYKQTPYIAVSRLNDSSFDPTPRGSLAVFKVFLKLPPRSVGDWSIRASTLSDTDLSVCSVYIEEFGYGIPCLNISTRMRTVDRPVVGGVDSGFLELYKLTNVGSGTLYGDNIFDNNSVVVEVVVQVSKGAVIGSSHNVIISVDYGMNGTDYSRNMSINVSDSGPVQYSPTAPQPVLNFYQSPVNSNATVSNSVYKGQTVILTSEIVIPSLSRSDIVVTIYSTPQTPLSAIDLAIVDVVWVGPNIPCLRKQPFTANMTSWPGSYTHDKAVVDLGTACNWPVDTTLPDNDMIRVEAIATVVRNSTAVSGNTIVLNSVITVNGTNLTSQQITLTLTNTIDNIEYSNPLTASMADIQFNMSNTTVVSLSPADTYTFYTNVIVPANSTVFGFIDIKLPNDSYSASMTVVSSAVMSVGINLGSYASLPVDFPIKCNSTFGSSQMDHCYIDFGKITNTGHTYRSAKYQTGDDSIQFKIVIQMTDALVNTPNSLHNVSIGAKLGLPMVFRSFQVTTIRSGNESPNIIVIPTVNSTVNVSSGQLVTMDVSIYHDNTSMAEGQNVEVMLYLTPYVVFQQLVSSSFIGHLPNITNMTDNQAVVFGFDHVYFTDNFTFRLTLLVVTGLGATGQSELSAMSLETVSKLNFRSGDFPSPMRSLNFTVIPPKAAAAAGVSGSPLGMANLGIKDCQLSASSAPVPGQEAIYARKGGSSGLTIGSRLGSNFSRYLQVHFANLTRVTTVELEHPTSIAARSAVRQFMVQYSNDGINWVDGEMVSTVSTYGVSTYSTPVTLSSPVDSSYLRLVVTDPPANGATNMVALRAEFYGTSTATLPITAAEVCNVRHGWQKTTTPPAEFYTRGYLVASTATPATTYFCDSKPNGDINCFSSTNGNAWQAIDVSVANIVGYLPSLNQLYGIDQSHTAFVVSEDNGLTWTAVSSQRVAWAALQSGYIKAVTLKWIQDSTLFSSTVPPASPAWAANFDGMFYNAQKVSDWSSCCP